jgi:hypothetical protein
MLDKYVSIGLMISVNINWNKPEQEALSLIRVPTSVVICVGLCG